MDYKEEFLDLISDNRFEEARILLDQNRQSMNEDPFYYANMGWLLVHMERYQEAEIYLLKGIHIFEYDGWMYSQLGFCYHSQGKIHEGIRALLKAIDYGYEESWVYSEIGWGYKELGNYKDALYVFEDCLMDDPNNAWVLSQAAVCYAFLGQDADALDYFLKSYRIEPDNDARFDLANYYHEHKQYKEELEYLKQIVDDENPAYTQYMMARAYYLDHQDTLALDHAKQSLALGKDDTSIHSLVGDIYLALNKKEEADKAYNRSLHYYENALKLEEDRTWIYQEMIWIAHKQKDWQKKLSYLDRAIVEDETSLWLHYHYARCYSDLNAFKEAIKECAYCVTHGEEGIDMLDLYAWNLGRDLQFEQAIAILKKRISLYGCDEWCYGELGSNYMQINAFQEAFQCFSDGIKEAKDQAYFYSMLGMCKFQLHGYEEALQYLLKAKELGRADGWIYASIAETLVKLNRKEDANSYFLKASELGYLDSK